MVAPAHHRFTFDDYLDRGEKLEHYKQVPSLEEVLLVHHDERKITAWRRTGPRWTVTERQKVPSRSR